jgi:sulfite reductase (ferredoxin)
MAGGSSPVEQIKLDSKGLRGTIQQTLKDPNATHFSEEEYQLLKFHGSYQQDDRDLRNQRKAAGLDKAWIFMIRTKTPGGAMTSRQYLDMDKLCGDIANGTLRITSRQGLQFHGVLKTGLKECIRRINASGITTSGACGDVVRNTLSSAVPYAREEYRDALKLSEELTETFLAKSTAYAEIWLNDAKLTPEDPVVQEEPIYGKVYLPRKFKIAIAIPPINDVDVLTNDLGFIAHVGKSGIEGYTVTVGGGFGMSHGQTKTFPCLAKPLFYVKKEHAIAAAIAVVTTQRDFGNREDRKQSRLKYLIDTRGLDWFRKEVISRMTVPTESAKPFEFTTVSDVFGWHEQGDGKLFVGIKVSEGRIKDTDKVKYRSAFRLISEKYPLPIKLSANSNLYFYDIEPSQKDGIQKILSDHHVPAAESLTQAYRMSHACVSLPTCGLGLAESERAFPGVMHEVDKVLRDLKLENEPILIRMSGCPNGCSRPYNSDFAFVGRAPGKYAFYVGGSSVGDRLAGLEKKVINVEEIPKLLRSYLEEFRDQRTPGETFSRYWGRTHKNGPAPTPEQFHVELAAREAAKTSAGATAQ